VNSQLKLVGSVCVTLMLVLGWMTVIGLTYREWHVFTGPARLSALGLVISFPLPWVGMVKEKFANWRMGLLCYVALINALWLFLLWHR
jgi:hypothetical protein